VEKGARLTLTFDNGPDPVGTPFVLEQLRQRDLHATFFAVGTQLEQPGGRQLLAQAASEGHWVGNHSMTHRVPFGEDQTPGAAVREIGCMSSALEGLGGGEKLFRPFGGGGRIGPHLFNQEALAYLITNVYTVVLWNSVPRDWLDPTGWPERAHRQLADHDWTVMVLHDLAAEAMHQLPAFLDSVLAAGVEIVQEFPDECVPIRNGVTQGDLTAITAA
jgi:peptidoglycan/xylan/chitin deacetylase (PgdA/CDA1 family)